MSASGSVAHTASAYVSVEKAYKEGSGRKARLRGRRVLVLSQEPRLAVMAKLPKSQAGARRARDTKNHCAVELPTSPTKREWFYVNVASAAELLNVSSGEAREILRQGKLLDKVQKIARQKAISPTVKKLSLDKVEQYQASTLAGLDDVQLTERGFHTRREAEELVQIAAQKLHAVPKERREEGIVCQLKGRRCHVHPSQKAKYRLSITILEVEEELGEGTTMIARACPRLGTPRGSPRSTLAWLSVRDMTPRVLLQLQSQKKVMDRLLQAAREEKEAGRVYPPGVPRKNYPVYNSQEELRGFLNRRGIDGLQWLEKNPDACPLLRIHLMTKAIQAFSWMYKNGFVDADRKPENLILIPPADADDEVSDDSEADWDVEHCDLGGGIFQDDVRPIDILHYTFSLAYSTRRDLIDNMLRLEQMAERQRELAPHMQKINDLYYNKQDYEDEERQLLEKVEQSEKLKQIYGMFAKEAWEIRVKHGSFAMGVCVGAFLTGIQTVRVNSMLGTTDQFACSPRNQQSLTLGRKSWVMEVFARECAKMYTTPGAELICGVLDKVLSSDPSARLTPDKLEEEWLAIVPELTSLVSSGASSAVASSSTL